MSSNELSQVIAVADQAILYLVCGKAGAGKSTLAKRLAGKQHSVLIEEDAWLARLYPDEIHDLADYVRRTKQVREVLGGHIEALLRQGLSVVLDFPANTLASRRWAKTIIEKAAVGHELHYLDVSDDTCKARLRERNAAGSHPFAVSEEAFDEVTNYFVPPAPDEGFTIIRHG